MHLHTSKLLCPIFSINIICLQSIFFPSHLILVCFRVFLHCIRTSHPLFQIVRWISFNFSHFCCSFCIAIQSNCVVSLALTQWMPCIPAILSCINMTKAIGPRMFIYMCISCLCTAFFRSPNDWSNNRFSETGKFSIKAGAKQKPKQPRPTNRNKIKKNNKI